MESMGKRGDRLREAKQAAAREQAGTETPKADPTLDQILSAESQEFGEYLESVADPRFKQVAERVKSGTSDPTNLPILIEARAGYLERRKSGELLVSTIAEYTQEMLRESPSLRTVVETVGEEKFRRVLQQGMRSLARKDAGEARRILGEYQKLKEFEKNVDKPLTEKISKFISNPSLEASPDADQIFEALHAANKSERIKNLKKLINVGWFDFTKRGLVKELSQQDTKAFMERRDRLLRDAGNFLHALVLTDRPEIREALERVSTMEEPPYKEGVETTMSFEQMKAQRGAPEAVGEVAVKERAADYAKKHEAELKKGGPKADKLRENFYLDEEIRAAEFEKQAKKNTGFWGIVWRGVTALFVPRGNADIDRILRP